MPKFEVTLTRTLKLYQSAQVEVEADSEEEAKEVAWDVAFVADVEWVRLSSEADDHEADVREAL